jgi:hypothetical protein
VPDNTKFPLRVAAPEKVPVPNPAPDPKVGVPEKLGLPLKVVIAAVAIVDVPVTFSLVTFIVPVLSPCVPLPKSKTPAESLEIPVSAFQFNVMPLVICKAPVMVPPANGKYVPLKLGMSAATSAL